MKQKRRVGKHIFQCKNVSLNVYFGHYTSISAEKRLNKKRLEKFFTRQILRSYFAICLVKVREENKTEKCTLPFGFSLISAK